MTPEPLSSATVAPLDAEVVALVRLAAIIAAGSDAQVREAFTTAVNRVRSEWIEEVVLQSYLFAGFPRALNAAREWRRTSGRPAPVDDPGTRIDDAASWQTRGTETCAIVYGASYERLRQNIRALHPALDSWMIVEGYGKVLSRPGLALRLRELCIIGACAAARQERQLHAHLRGALNAGATPAEVAASIEIIGDLLGDAEAARYRSLAVRVIASQAPPS